MVKRDVQGRFQVGTVANPAGNNQFTTLVPLLNALERGGKKHKEDFWDMVVRKAWTSDRILVAVMKKILPDKLKTDYDPKEYHGKNPEFSHLSDEELMEKVKDMFSGEILDELKAEGKIP